MLISIPFPRFRRWLDRLVVVLVIFLLGVVRPDLLMILVYFSIFPYLFFTRRTHLFIYLFFSTLLALLWMLIAKQEYGYNQDFITLFGINLFAFFAWASGLLGSYLLYSHFKERLPSKHWAIHFLFFLAIYWPILISLETLAYYGFGIHNLASSAYPGLPICQCMHAPRWMQASYLLLGPLYFVIVSLFEFLKARKNRLHTRS